LSTKESNKLLVATRNRGKLAEYEAMLAAHGFQLLTLDDVDIDLDIDETGETFEENALLKAKGYSELSRLLTLADDSGLEVDALGGAPGVHSARYGGEGLNDTDRYYRVLREMTDVPPDERTARFRCVIALCTPQGETFTAHGTLEGSIAFEPAGNFGFGYDPIFYVMGLRSTLGQVDPERKNRISHRANALKSMMPSLLEAAEYHR